MWLVCKAWGGGSWGADGCSQYPPRLLILSLPSPVDGSISFSLKRRMLASLPSATLPSARRSTVKVCPTPLRGITSSGITLASSNSGWGEGGTGCELPRGRLE